MGSSERERCLIVNVAALGLAVLSGSVVALVGGIRCGVFLRVGSRGAGSGQKQGRAGGQQQGVGAQAFHTAKVRPGSLKVKAGSSIFYCAGPAFAIPAQLLNTRLSFQ